MPGRPATLLLAEDNPGDVRLVREAVSETPFTETLHVVSDGDETLDFVHQRNEYTDVRRPDLVLLDWHLPGTSGEQILMEMKDDPTLNRTPVVVLTGFQSEREVLKAYANHANACLPKPNDPEELIDAIHVLEKFWLKVARLPGSDEDETQ